jgi:polyisoprenoid-binding protein YceI|tara:strand:+ start:58795 stop:59427 length:633 start_codon:yes stop_codon:yes gene_type:complete
MQRIKYNQYDRLMKAILLQYILVTLLAISSHFPLLAQSPTVLNTVILDSSSLQISGSSNINEFECIYRGVFNPSTFRHTLLFQDNRYVIEGDTLKLVIEDFDCGRRGINRDFRNTLKNSDFPTIDITPIEFTNTGSLLSEIKISISLAGVTKNYTLNFESDSPSEGVFRINGRQKLTIRDFNIEPPKALFGLIKVENELVISFDIFLRHL